MICLLEMQWVARLPRPFVLPRLGIGYRRRHYPTALPQGHDSPSHAPNTIDHSSDSHPAQIPETIGGVSGAMFRYMCESGSPIIRDVLGLKVMSAKYKHLEMRMRLQPKFWLKGRGVDVVQTHSGILAAVTDHVGGLCAWTVLERSGFLLSTIDLHVDYVNSLVQNDKGIICAAEVVDSNEKLIRVDITCWNYAKTKRLSIGRALYNVYENRESIKRLQSVVLQVIRNNYSATSLLLDTFRKQLMATHKLVHKWKHLRAPRQRSYGRINSGNFTDLEAAVIEFAERVDTYIRHTLYVKISHLTEGRVTLYLPYKPLFTGNFVTPCLHGGVTAALMEHCAQCCARTLPHVAKSTISSTLNTLGIRIDYLAPAPCFEDIICDSTLVGTEASTLWVDVVCWNQKKTVKVALGRVALSFLVN